MQRLLSQEMELMACVQDVSFCAKDFEKGMNPAIFPPVIGK